MPLVFAAIAPHGGIAIAEACSVDERDVAIKTRAGMEELGRLFEGAKPDVAVVATPHNVHICNALGVVVANRVAGRLNGVTPPIQLDLASDTQLAWRVLESLGAAGLSAVGVSFGSNDLATAVAPMDWGALIPLWFMGGRGTPPVQVVVVTPSRDLPGSDHLTAGAAIAAAAVVSELVGSDRLDRLLEIPRELVEKAKADSWWQMLMLQGATREAGRVQRAQWKGTLISYEAPTYFGMLTAAYAPAS